MIKPLTSLRFIFAFLVFLSHYVVDGSSLFSEGYIGVSFFFILSGFILAYSYKDRLLSGTTSKSEFFVARFARIYPLHLITFSAYFALAILASTSINWTTVAANVTLLQSWIPSEGYYFSFNAPSWSISDEMFFYLMFPFLILFFYRVKSAIKWSSIIVILICYCLALLFMGGSSKLSHAFAYVNPLFRILDFAIGIGVYKLWQKVQHSDKITRWLSNVWRVTILELFSVALLVVMIFFSYDLPQIIRYSCYYWLPMSFIICVFATSSVTQIGGGYLSKLLSLKFAVLLGEISFGFYMLHVLTMTVLGYVFTKLGLSLPTVVHFVLVALTITGVSLASYYWFETPANKWIKRMYKQRVNGK